MSTPTETRGKAAGAVMRELPASAGNAKAWVAKAAKAPMVLETVDLGPLGAEEVEVGMTAGIERQSLSIDFNGHTR